MTSLAYRVSEELFESATLPDLHVISRIEASIRIPEISCFFIRKNPVKIEMQIKSEAGIFP